MEKSGTRCRFAQMYLLIGIVLFTASWQRIGNSGGRCVFKIQKKPGRIPNKTIISGVGTGSVSFASPIIFTAVATTGEYEMFSFPTGYFMLDLDFAIMPCAHLEKAGYDFTLSASFSRTKTPSGVVVPFVRDAQTGFHFLIDHLLAAPGLRAKHNIAEHFKRSGDPGEVNDLPPQTDAESCPAEPDSADTPIASLQSDLGGAVAYKDAVAAQKSAQTVDSRGQVIEDARDKVVVLDEPMDLDREMRQGIKQASKHIEGAELVKLLNLAGSLPDEHCSGCVEGKSRMMPRPKGRTERPIPRGRRSDRLAAHTTVLSVTSCRGDWIVVEFAFVCHHQRFLTPPFPRASSSHTYETRTRAQCR
jgi:hypothetical protein